MAVKSGQFAKVTLKVGSTTVTVAKLREWSVSVSTEKLDSSAAGSKWGTHEIGIATWEGESSFIDADQYWLESLFDKVAIEFYDKDDDTDPVYTGVCSLDFDRTVPYDGLIETSVSLTGDGELKLGSAA